MKKSHFLSYLALYLSLFFIYSCEKSGDPIPQNSYAGSWFNQEVSSNYGQATYPLSIEEQNAATINFAFLYGYKTKISADVIGNSFTIPSQIIEGSSVSGSGRLLTPSNISLTYFVDNGLFVDTVEARLTK